MGLVGASPATCCIAAVLFTVTRPRRAVKKIIHKCFIAFLHDRVQLPRLAGRHVGNVSPPVPVLVPILPVRTGLRWAPLLWNRVRGR